MSKDSRSAPSLRDVAEARLAVTPAPEIQPPEALLHELQVHQIELEMQNESLRQAQVELEASRDRYVDLYDFAPVGYFTLARDGLIEALNLTGAALLGEDRQRLRGRRFVHFVAPHARDRWHRLFVQVLRDTRAQKCELTLQRSDGTPFQASLSCTQRGGPPAFVRLAISDISDQYQTRLELEASEATQKSLSMRLTAILDAVPEIIAEVDADKIYTWMNPAGLDFFGEAAIGRTAAEFFVNEQATYQVVEPVFAGTDAVIYVESWQRRRDGETRLLAWWCRALKDADGRVVGALSSARDITEQRHAEEALRIAAIAFESQEGIMVTDAHGVIVRVNHAFTRLTGYRAEEAIGQTPAMLRSGRHDKPYYDSMWQSLREQGYWQGEMWNRRKNGKIYAEWLTISAVRTPAGETTHYVGTFSEITRNKEAEAEIHRLAYYDPLTHLPNRRLLMDRLAQALASSARGGRHGAVIFLDLDNFKILNDTRGHAAGDLLLGEVARRLQYGMREGDTISRLGDTISRLGGDEFVLVLEDLSPEAIEAAGQARLIGEKVRENLARPYDLEGQEHHTSASLGVTLFLDHEQPVETLLRQADLALYQAKAAGRNCLRFFDPSMQSALDERSALEADLRLAVERGQLRLYYQPQLDSKRQVIGAEALLRWQHPERGLVAPDAFIPLAEETGLILPIGRWVLETACARIKAWSGHAASRDLRLAVNVSARQFRQAGFVAEVAQVLRDSGADPGRLKIELTESVVLDSVVETIERMQALKALGIGFSMDDFGTGFSSLSYLKRLPLDQLKIDRSFVADLASNHNDAAIVQTIITMGRTLGLDVIAEGVETEAQLERLDQFGCAAFQGYLFSRPLPVEAFDAWLRAHPLA